MAGTAGDSEQRGPVRLIQLLHGKILAQAICAAAELKIADCIGDTPVGCAVLAEQTRTDAGSLYRLMRLMASFGVFTELPQRTFAHTPDSLYLKRDTPGSIQAIARMIGADWHAIAETRMLHSLRSGESAFKATHAMGVFDYLSSHADAGEVFDEAMTGLSETTNRAIVGGYDFAKASLVVDVGGGRGSLLCSILRAHPHLRGVLFDMPGAIREALVAVESAGVQERCTLKEGSFFDSVPPGGDLYVLKYILHDWDDADAVRIMKACRAAMPKGSKLLIVEDLIGEPNVPSGAKITDLEMLVIFGGRERTTAEYSQLVGAAGFELGSVVPAQPVFLLEALPANAVRKR